jgi:hypothetical protein
MILHFPFEKFKTQLMAKIMVRSQTNSLDLTHLNSKKKKGPNEF